MNSSREYISVLTGFGKVISGPTPFQIAVSLCLADGYPKTVYFEVLPKSGKSIAKLIGGVISSAKVIDQNGPSWMLVIGDIILPGSNNIAKERFVKIYYHATVEGIILSE